MEERESLPERLARDVITRVGLDITSEVEAAIAAAIRAALDEAASILDAKAFSEECADETMAGRTRAMPFRHLAAAIRALKG